MDAPVMLSPEATLREHTEYLVQALAESDAELEKSTAKFDVIVASSNAALVDARCELADRNLTIQTLQNSVHELQLVVAEEREKAARITAERDVLTALVDEDRTKIDVLLSMRQTEHRRQGDVVILSQTAGAAAAPIQPSHSDPCIHHPHLPMRKEVIVDVGCSGPGASLSLRTTVDAAKASPSTNGLGEKHAAHAATRGSEDVLLTLTEETRILSRLLDEQRASYERDRQARVEATRISDKLHHSNLQKQHDESKKLREQLSVATRDVCRERHVRLRNERHLMGDIEVLTARASEAERLLAIERQRRSGDMRVALEAATHRSNEAADALRIQLQQLSDRKKSDAHLAEERCAQLEEQTASLQGQLSREKVMRQRSEQRRVAESGGAASEVRLVRQQLRSVEKRLFFEAAADGRVAAAAAAVADRIIPRQSTCQYRDPNILMQSSPLADAQMRQQELMSVAHVPVAVDAEMTVNEGYMDSAAVPVGVEVPAVMIAAGMELSSETPNSAGDAQLVGQPPRFHQQQPRIMAPADRTQQRQVAPHRRSTPTTRRPGSAAPPAVSQHGHVNSFGTRVPRPSGTSVSASGRASRPVTPQKRVAAPAVRNRSSRTIRTVTALGRRNEAGVARAVGQSPRRRGSTSGVTRPVLTSGTRQFDDDPLGVPVAESVPARVAASQNHQTVARALSSVLPTQSGPTASVATPGHAVPSSATLPSGGEQLRRSVSDGGGQPYAEQLRKLERRVQVQLRQRAASPVAL